MTSTTYSKPDEFTPNDEKLEKDYALAYARYIESMHYKNDGYQNRRREWEENQAYAQGYQSMSKIKKDLLKGKDKSYGYLDFTPLNIIPKYAKVIKKNLNLELFDSKCKSIDNSSMEMRKNERNNMVSKMINQKINQRMSDLTNVDFNPKGFIPKSDEDIDVYMEVESKLPQEIAIEQSIAVVKEANFHNEILDKLASDAITYGMSIVKDDYEPELGVRIKRINPIDFITSYDGSEMNDNRGSFYNGHVEEIAINDLHRLYDVSEQDFTMFARNTKQRNITKLSNKDKWSDIRSTMVEVLFFEFKTTFTNTYRKKIKKNGKISVTKKDDEYNLNHMNIETYKQSKEVWIEGVWVIDSDIVLEYGIRNNQVIDSLKKVRSTYSAYDTDEMASVRKMIPFADNMNKHMIKINQMVASARPKGLAINVSSLLDVPNPDGSGDRYSYLKLIDMYDGTGNQLFRQDEFSAGQGLPLTEVENGLPKDIGKYVDLWNHNLNQINNIVGIDPILSGSGATARVSTESNQIALASSVKAIEYIKDGLLSIEKRLSENIILRIQDIDKYDKPFKKYVQALGRYNLRALMELDSLHPFTFSLFIEMKPSVEEREGLNQDLQLAMSAGQITVPDKIDILRITNMKLASLMLKRKINENLEMAHQRQLQLTEAGNASKMAEIQEKGNLIQLQHQSASELSNQQYIQDKDLLAMKLSMENQQKYAQEANKFGKESRDKQHDSDKISYQQGQMNKRHQDKLDAYEKGQLSKESNKNLEKA